MSEDNTTLQDTLMSIVESFSEYFYNFAGNIYGKRPTKLTFSKVSVAGKIGMTGLQLVKVEFNTDLGPASSALAVKIFPDGDQAKEEAVKIQHVKKRIAAFSKHGIKTADVIFYAGPVIVMEGIRGESFRASPVPLTEKYRMAGRALAALHGDTDNPVVNDKNSQLVKLIVPELPIDEETKKRILDRFDELFPKLDKNRGGTVTLGDFHPGNIIYEIDLQKEPILSAHLIDPEFIEMDAIFDRFEDITNFFFNRCIQEYMQKGKLFQSLAEIGYFVAGYNEILAYFNMDLFDFYEYNSINLHLAQRILFSIANLQQVTRDAVYFNEQVMGRIKLVEELLRSEPIYSSRLG